MEAVCSRLKKPAQPLALMIAFTVDERTNRYQRRREKQQVKLAK